MPNDRGDQDLIVGRAHILVADHDHYRVFNKCGLALSFLDPPAPASMPNGTQHAGIESGVEGFYYDTVDYAKIITPGFDHLADERVINDPVTNRFIAMATKPSNEGIFLGISEPHDARNWLQSRIKAIPMEVPCVRADGALHRGSISTSNDPLNAGDRLVWFLGEIQFPACLTCPCPNTLFVWNVGKIRMSQLLNGNPDPDSWWQESAYDYANFAPTLARRLTDDESPQYAIGVHHSANSLRLLALRADEDALGHLLPPHQHTISLTLPPYNQPALIPLPDGFPTTEPKTTIKQFPMADIWKAVYRDGYVWAVHCAGQAGRRIAASCDGTRSP